MKAGKNLTEPPHGSQTPRDFWARRMVRRLVATRWNVGFLDATDLGSVVLGRGPAVRWMRHTYRDRWFADPFILAVNATTIELLVEEWVDELRRGRISKLVVDRPTLVLRRVTPLLDTGSHLSFPAIYRHAGQVFVQPESCANGSSLLYRYDEQSETLSPTRTVLAEPLTDAVILPEPMEGRFYMFSTQLPDPCGGSLDVYSSAQWDAGYTKHSTIQFEGRQARNAGAFFKLDGYWVRPAQDCNKRYGHGLIFQRLEMNHGRFSFRELGRRYPDSRQWPLGIHTFNVRDGLAVVDGHAWRTPYAGAVLASMGLRKLLSHLHQGVRGR